MTNFAHLARAVQDLRLLQGSGGEVQKAKKVNQQFEQQQFEKRFCLLAKHSAILEDEACPLEKLERFSRLAYKFDVYGALLSCLTGVQEDLREKAGVAVNKIAARKLASLLDALDPQIHCNDENFKERISLFKSIIDAEDIQLILHATGYGDESYHMTDSTKRSTYFMEYFKDKTDFCADKNNRQLIKDLTCLVTGLEPDKAAAVVSSIGNMAQYSTTNWSEVSRQTSGSIGDVNKIYRGAGSAASAASMYISNTMHAAISKCCWQLEDIINLAATYREFCERFQPSVLRAVIRSVGYITRIKYPWYNEASKNRAIRKEALAHAIELHKENEIISNTKHFAETFHSILQTTEEVHSVGILKRIFDEYKNTDGLVTAIYSFLGWVVDNPSYFWNIPAQSYHDVLESRNINRVMNVLLTDNVKQQLISPGSINADALAPSTGYEDPEHDYYQKFVGDYVYKNQKYSVHGKMMLEKMSAVLDAFFNKNILDEFKRNQGLSSHEYLMLAVKQASRLDEATIARIDNLYALVQLQKDIYRQGMMRCFDNSISRIGFITKDSAAVNTMLDIIEERFDPDPNRRNLNRDLQTALNITSNVVYRAKDSTDAKELLNWFYNLSKTRPGLFTEDFLTNKQQDNTKKLYGVVRKKLDELGYFKREAAASYYDPNMHWYICFGQSGL